MDNMPQPKRNTVEMQYQRRRQRLRWLRLVGISVWFLCITVSFVISAFVLYALYI